MPLDLGQELREVEPTGAGGLGRFEVGTCPVACFSRETGIFAPRSGSVAKLLVIGQEPRQVAELGLGACGGHAPTVAICAQAWFGGEKHVAELADVRLFEWLEAAGGVARPLAGTLEARGVACERALTAGSIAGAPLDPPLPPDWSPLEYATWSARLAGLPRDDARARAAAAFEATRNAPTPMGQPASGAPL